MDRNKIMNIGGVDCYEENGTAYLKLETVARGLGFTKTADSGNQVVNWTRVRSYLLDFGVVQKCSTGDYIPENIFYRLAMKAKNKTAEKFQALVADEIIPSIRKTGGYVASSDMFVNAYFPGISEDQRGILKIMLDNTTKLNTQVKEMTPKADYYDKAVNRGDALNIRDTAKILGIGERKFVRFLSVCGYIYRDSKKRIRPVAEYAEKGWFTLKEFGDENYNGAQMLITFKGRTNLLKEIESAKKPFAEEAC